MTIRRKGKVMVLMKIETVLMVMVILTRLNLVVIALFLGMIGKNLLLAAMVKMIQYRHITCK